jgi:hypothetical protein
LAAAGAVVVAVVPWFWQEAKNAMPSTAAIKQSVYLFIGFSLSSSSAESLIALKTSQSATNEALPRSGLRTLALQKSERFVFAMLHLINRALARRFVRPPTQNFCAVAETATGKMVVGNFYDHSWSDWFPFAGAFGAPTARAARSVASESRWFC